jgi:cysteine sulfinate desulfinase/cysteine desulfurase-like protein
VPKNIEQFLEPAGHTATVVGVLSNGLVDLEAFTAALTPNTRMVSVMLVQNETGIVQPIREICDAAHQVGALVHVDACQAAGKIPINVVDLGADLLSIAGHKFSGPPGTGALFVRRGVDIPPLIVGAAQQGGRRAGTEAVMNCAAMGVACCEAQKWLSGNGPFFQLGIRGRVVQFIKKWCRENDMAVVFHGEGSPVVPTVSPPVSLSLPSFSHVPPSEHPYCSNLNIFLCIIFSQC